MKLDDRNLDGDCILGEGANVEAGAIIANDRNELDDRRIRIIIDGVAKFGVLAGDRVRIGANALIAPGAILHPGSKVARLALVDQ